ATNRGRTAVPRRGGAARGLRGRRARARAACAQFVDEVAERSSPVTNLELQLNLLGADLHRAVGALAARRRRRVRRMRFVAVVLAAFGTFAAVAFASGIADELHLDPTKWTIVGGGSVDGGRGAFVKARNNDDRSESTFL